jgi:hypothetical protein
LFISTIDFDEFTGWVDLKARRHDSGNSNDAENWR